ncbi:hypothetical protein DAEQUDRAFT_720917 [Daedalea quercina L-15889]|uniref:Zn(2)-C6 fungal-type domain-containing protein n=1 Tax=Daedalea quercina L-15889 TaxID=1314783 RepID=A0A165TWH2_9APHY|nr:hypothetical protein DAEQUDRAFT_720917 [Daedalea quercina L-15889]
MTGEGANAQHNGGGKPSQRSRRVLNCAPCRKNKLKCDRKRPCSSCQLRKSESACRYEDEGYGGNGQWRFVGPQGETMDTYEAESASDPEPEQVINMPVEQSCLVGGAAPGAQHDANISNQIALVRQQLENLERQLKESKEGLPIPAVESLRAATQENQFDVDMAFDAPSAQAVQNPSGLFLGPTTDAFAVNQFAGRPSLSNGGYPCQFPVLDVRHHDADLVAQLPNENTVEYLINHYFEYCNWIYRFVHEPTIRDAWRRFRNKQPMSRVELATVCVVIAITIRYLPLDHALFRTLRGGAIELGNTYFKVSCDLLERHREITPTHRTYTLELVELVLAQTHYLIFSEKRREEVWILCGELLTITTAMGLHRDPQNVFPFEVAERRRWAWWNLMLVERWHAFSLGRPVRISADHFDVNLPAHNPNGLGEERRYLPNIALFKLMHISAATSDEAMANIKVTLPILQERDRLLTNWFDELPKEVFMDRDTLSNNLVSPMPHIRRLAVQATILRGLYNYIRFTLHRPNILMPMSLDIAIHCASDLIELMAQAHDSNTPGHFIWGPCQTFSVAMFFSLQIIVNPSQTRAHLYQEQIKKAITLFKPDCCLPGIADGAITILGTLSPLFESDLLANPTPEVTREKNEILALVNNMTYPHRELPDLDAFTVPESFDGVEMFAQTGWSGTSSPTRASSAASSHYQANAFVEPTPMYASDSSWQQQQASAVDPRVQQAYPRNPPSDSGHSYSPHSPPALSPGSSSESSGSSSPDVTAHVPQYALAQVATPPDTTGWAHEYQSQVSIGDEKMFAPNTYYDFPNAPAPTMQYNPDPNAIVYRIPPANNTFTRSF